MEKMEYGNGIWKYSSCGFSTLAAQERNGGAGGCREMAGGVGGGVGITDAQPHHHPLRCSVLLPGMHTGP